MAIKHPERFNAARPAGFDGIFEWDFLREAFLPTKIEPMDLDAIVERRMRFLCFETKDNGVPIPEGQRLTLENLVRTGYFTVIVMRGKTADDIKGWECWRWVSKRRIVEKDWHEGNAAALTAFVKTWFQWANGEAA